MLTKTKKKVGEKKSKRRRRREKRILGLSLRDFYLFLTQRLQLFGLALTVVFHDHHGGVDFANRQVCGC